ncbi:response regulator receiver sensor signal transduction histidine kinase [Calothrix sp. NIES-4071]|nr:response regulator receiver sensor signal transduction histidine kinase [Calothrix sp. NIES-4071]BAZ56842.1 response regulator receiver sensor signal transduction histidine kinase [Calothrix sp. NIES-4105]
MKNILVVEDERIIACDIRNFLERSGYNVPAIVAYGEQAIEKAEALVPDLILMDVMLKGEMSGIEAAEEIYSRCNIPVVYLTAYSDDSTLTKARHTQPFGYVLKPFDEAQLIATIEIALSRHRNEVVMQEALAKEKTLRQLKSQFVSKVSHEFRNPLSSIITSTELLVVHGNKIGESKKSEYLNHIKKAATQMTDLLSDVLLVGQAECSKVNFNPAPLNLEKFCIELTEEIEHCTRNTNQIIFAVQGRCARQDNTSTADVQCLEHDSKNIHTTNQLTSIKEATTQLPLLDEKLLRHILTNLLTNAIKYSPNGEAVKFDLFCLQEEAIFRIQDKGIGIPYIDQEELFNEFHRCRNVGNIPGNGLGLSIVKQYVEMHGGDITFVSKEGVGTTFIVSIPLKNS